MEQLLNQFFYGKYISYKKYLWVYKIILSCAYGQLKIFEETWRHCSFAVKGSLIFKSNSDLNVLQVVSGFILLEIDNLEANTAKRENTEGKL